MAKFNERIKKAAKVSSIILANDYDSRTPKVELKTIQNIKYPLLITLTIQILGLIHFTIDKVHNFLPDGNNEYLDAIYHNRTSIEILSITISSVMILSILFRKENKYHIKRKKQ